jgi:hypothetical protein
MIKSDKGVDYNMDMENVEFANLAESDLQKLNKMERALEDRNKKKVILLAYEVND